jgi:hypothetical protein
VVDDSGPPAWPEGVGPFVALSRELAQISDEGTKMYGRNFLMDEMLESDGMSRSAVALCCAIIEDAEVAREFEMEPRGALEMLRAAMLGPSQVPCENGPLPRDLTSLIA